MSSDGFGEGGRSSDFSATGVAILANDLRNLLTVMVSCIDSIRSSVPPHPVVDQSFAELDGAIDSAFYISREMLGVARPHRVEPAVLDVNELIEQAKGVLKRILGPNIRLSLDLAAPAPIVRADVVQLEWVLLNVAANAADAMPHGGLLKIETAAVDIPSDVATETATAARHHVRITATDTGSGMTSEVLHRALEPFFSTKEQGTGIGLTSAAVTVRRLDGWLQIENNAPYGTRIDIYLPILGATPRH